MLNKTFMISFKAVVTGVTFGLFLATSSIAVAGDDPFESIDSEKSYLLAGADQGEEGKSGEGEGGEDGMEEAKSESGEDSGEESGEDSGEDSGEEAKSGEDSGEEGESGEGEG